MPIKRSFNDIEANDEEGGRDLLCSTNVTDYEPQLIHQSDRIDTLGDEAQDLSQEFEHRGSSLIYDEASPPRPIDPAPLEMDDIFDFRDSLSLSGASMDMPELSRGSSAASICSTAQSSLYDNGPMRLPVVPGQCSLPEGSAQRLVEHRAVIARLSRLSLSSSRYNRSIATSLDPSLLSYEIQTRDNHHSSRSRIASQRLLTHTTSWVKEFRTGNERLRHAANDGDLPTVDALLLGKISVDSADSNGETALHKAAANGHTEIVRVLLLFGARVDRVDNSGNTALHKSVLGDHADSTRLLLHEDAGRASSSMEGYYLLHLAIEHNCVATIQVLLDAGIDPDSIGAQESLQSLDSVKKSLAIALAQERPICRASRLGFEAVVHILLIAGADAAFGMELDAALYHASGLGYVVLVQALIAAGANMHAKIIDDTGSVLHVATAHLRTGVIECLLDEGADIDAQNIYGLTALDIVIGLPNTSVMAQNGRLEVVRLLLSRGANLRGHSSRWEDSGILAQLLLSGIDETDVVEHLLLQGANPEYRDPACHQSSTPLYVAAITNSVAAAAALLAHGVNPDTLVHGETALSVACRKGNLKMAKMLLRNGAKPLSCGEPAIWCHCGMQLDEVSNDSSMLRAVLTGNHESSAEIVFSSVTISSFYANLLFAINRATGDMLKTFLDLHMDKLPQDDKDCVLDLIVGSCCKDGWSGPRVCDLMEIIENLVMFGASIETLRSESRVALYRLGFVELINTYS